MIFTPVTLLFLGTYFLSECSSLPNPSIERNHFNVLIPKSKPPRTDGIPSASEIRAYGYEKFMATSQQIHLYEESEEQCKSQCAETCKHFRFTNAECVFLSFMDENYCRCNSYPTENK